MISDSVTGQVFMIISPHLGFSLLPWDFPSSPWTCHLIFSSEHLNYSWLWSLSTIPVEVIWKTWWTSVNSWLVNLYWSIGRENMVNSCCICIITGDMVWSSNIYLLWGNCIIIQSPTLSLRELVCRWYWSFCSVLLGRISCWAPADDKLSAISS